MASDDLSSREEHFTHMIEYYQNETVRQNMALANAHAREVALTKQLELARRDIQSLLDTSGS